MAQHLPEPALKALHCAREALQKGDKQTTRRWAWKAVKHAPDQEEPWLYLATVSDPHAAAAYLNKALEINPDSERARQGMKWVAEQLRSSSSENKRKRSFSFHVPQEALVSSRPAFLPWSATLFLLLMALLVWLWTPEFSSALQAPTVTPRPTQNTTQASLQKATYTPTPTATFTPTPTFTPSPTPTNTPSATPKPTKTKKPASRNDRVNIPGGNTNQRWFDLDLSKQRLYAYQGDTLVKKFVVSTGTWRTPTVTGRYRVYVKYRYTDMAGPGYYLPDVPYTMYFYKGYGIHGTYWHNNFGTPMSHGCVNLRTSDARWAYNWAIVGTVVNIHY